MNLPARFRFPPPVAELIGLEFHGAADGRSRMSLEAGERHTNPMGTVHGGILCDLADAAMGTAWASQLEDGETFTTLELKINYTRPLRREVGPVRCVGTVIHIGSRVATSEARVVDAAGKIYAHGTTTCILVEPS